MAQKIKESAKQIITDPKDPKRFEVLKDGWIKDHLKEIDRGPDAPREMNKKEAEKYCKGLGGRLETVDEMNSIIDRSKYNPAVISTYPGKVKSGWYWTRDKYVGCSGASWVVSFDFGNVGGDIEGRKFYVRPVRASQ